MCIERLATVTRTVGGRACRIWETFTDRFHPLMVVALVGVSMCVAFLAFIGLPGNPAAEWHLMAAGQLAAILAVCIAGSHVLK